MKNLEFKKDLKQIILFLKKFSPSITVICILSIVMSITESFSVTLVIPLLQGAGGSQGILLPFPFSRIVGFFSGMAVKERIQLVALLMIFIVGFKGTLSYINNIFSFHLQQDTIKHYRMLCFEQLMRIKMGYFNSQRFGSIQSLVTMNTQYVGALIYSCVILIPSFFSLVIFMTMLFFLSWKLTLFAMPLVILASFALRRTAHRTNTAGKGADAAFQNMSSTLLDMLSGMKVVRLFNREKDMIVKFNSEADSVKQAVFRLDKAKAVASPLYEFTGVASLAVVMFLGSFFLEHYGQFSLQILLVFLFIFFRMIIMANSFNNSRVLFAGYLPFLGRVYRFIEETGDLYINNGNRRFLGLKSKIEICNLTFRYNPNEKIVLSDISCFIPKGAKVGIVGPSGSGKSTITELLLRFFDPQQGAILVDGVDLREMDINYWRRHIGVVTQETFLFNDTVLNNIAFAKPDAVHIEIENASRKAHAFDFIQELPKGFETVLGERGVRLSGGQKQRIAIARAILSEPEILVFDEATSALDTKSERIVQEAMDDVGRGKTVITIAHRLSTIADADMIFVITDGRIAQRGTHQELLREEGQYKNLVMLQKLEG